MLHNYPASIRDTCHMHIINCKTVMHSAMMHIYSRTLELCLWVCKFKYICLVQQHSTIEEGLRKLSSKMFNLESK